jgi:TRAP-type C4-dicarboxylate transport system permease small subunit
LRKKLQNSIENLIVLLYGGFVILVFVQVIARYVFNYPFIWTEELARFFFIWMVMLGVAIAIHRGAHLGFDILLDAFPLKIRKIVGIVNNVLMLTFVSILIVKGFELSSKTMEGLSPALEVPMGIPYLAIPVSGILMAGYILHAIYLTVRELRHTEQEG